MLNEVTAIDSSGSAFNRLARWNLLTKLFTRSVYCAPFALRGRYVLRLPRSTFYLAVEGCLTTKYCGFRSGQVDCCFETVATIICVSNLRLELYEGDSWLALETIGQIVTLFVYWRLLKSSPSRTATVYPLDVALSHHCDSALIYLLSPSRYPAHLHLSLHTRVPKSATLFFGISSLGRRSIWVKSHINLIAIINSGCLLNDSRLVIMRKNDTAFP